MRVLTLLGFIGFGGYPISAASRVIWNRTRTYSTEYTRMRGIMYTFMTTLLLISAHIHIGIEGLRVTIRDLIESRDPLYCDGAKGGISESR